MLISVGHKETVRIQSRFKGPSFTRFFHIIYNAKIVYTSVISFWTSGLSSIGNIKKMSDSRTHIRYVIKVR